MERRYKIGVISNNEVMNHSKDNPDDFPKALKAKLPDKTMIISQDSDMSIASLVILMHNPEWPKVPLGKKVERFYIDLGDVEKPSSIILAH